MNSTKLIILWLVKEKNSSVASIRGYISGSKGLISENLKYLEAKNLLEREKIGRKKIITITKNGSKLLKKSDLYLAYHELVGKKLLNEKINEALKNLK